MPTLIAHGHNAQNNAFIWACSECKEVFSVDRLTSKPSQKQIAAVNTAFVRHCDEKHPGVKPVLGIEVEDVNQAAARIVREATED